MAREISAGGVVIRHMRGGWHMAVIEPAGRGAQTRPGRKPTRGVLALPKGLVDKGEKPEQTALREVREETGVEAAFLGKLGDIKYTYVRSWGDGEKVFKIVSFYLLKYTSGEIGDIKPAMRKEVSRAEWIPLHDAERVLSYKGERDMVAKAMAYIQSHPDLAPAVV
ncbi:MAG TPA: NUDIX domain-containing protein [Terriglobales bacterium]|nr:NUDIX domain-containing protein [Terriglobales bacterium]